MKKMTTVGSQSLDSCSGASGFTHHCLCSVTTNVDTEEKANATVS